MNSDGLDDRPTIIALAGSNGAGKSTFYETQLASLGWPFVNADLLARELNVDPYKAAGPITLNSLATWGSLSVTM